jgi:hypothetical protein
MKKTCVIIFLLSIFISAHPVVVLVHGTLAQERKWYRPGGKFYDELEKQALKQKQVLVSFTWSGKLGEKARINGAKSLAKLIISYPKEEKIILVGHSHGGNVINFASKLLFDPFENIDAKEKDILDFLDKHFSSLDNAITLSGARGRINMKKQAIDTWLSIRKTKLALEEGSFAVKKKKKGKEKKYKIDEAYLLATPVDTIYYAPNMEVIGCVYNIFSLGDMLQPVGGIYKRMYPEQDRLWNIRLKISESRDPTHMQMHHPIIAEHLFEIRDFYALPETVEKEINLIFPELMEEEVVEKKIKETIEEETEETAEEVVDKK